MEHPEDKEQDPTMPASEDEAQVEETTDAESSENEQQLDAAALDADEAAEVQSPDAAGAEDEEPLDVTAEADEASEPEAGEVDEPAEAEEPSGTESVEDPAEPDVSPELVAAVNEAFAESDVAVEGDVEGAEAEEEEDILLDWQPGQWFVVHTYAGYENKVKTNLESRILSMNMEEKIHEVVIPTEDVMEVKSGKKQVVQKKVFPGYLLVRMDLDDDSWYVVRNTPGVTGFVGSGTKPIPLSDKEVDRVLQRKVTEERPKPRLEFTAGDGVRVVTGPFANFQGVISDIDADRSKLKVLVNIFGRETPVELGFDQVAKI